MVAELEDDALSASYLRGANLISRTTTAIEYYTFNAHGDVVGLVNATGTQTKTYDYDAFGNEKDRVGADPNPFRYCGEYFDVESGAYYLRARYYDPSIGRFTQEDPEKDGLNWYTYCNNNPVLFIDPTGCQYVCADDFGGSSKPEPEPAKKDTAAERKRAHDEEKARALYEANMKEMEENYARKIEEPTKMGSDDHIFREIISEKSYEGMDAVVKLVIMTGETVLDFYIVKAEVELITAATSMGIGSDLVLTTIGQKLCWDIAKIGINISNIIVGIILYIQDEGFVVYTLEVPIDSLPISIPIASVIGGRISPEDPPIRDLTIDIKNSRRI